MIMINNDHYGGGGGGGVGACGGGDDGDDVDDVGYHSDDKINGEMRSIQTGN